MDSSAEQEEERPKGAYGSVIYGLETLCCVVLAGMSLWITYEVVMRYFFSSPTIWAVDLSEYSLLAITFLGAPCLLRVNGHVRIAFLADRAPPPLRRGLALGTALLGAAIAGCLAFLSARTALDFYHRDLWFVRAWQVPQWPLYAIMALGWALLCLEFLRSLFLRPSASEGSGGLL